MATDLAENLAATAFAFRGYNITNLGRTGELLAHDKYGPIVADYLGRASRLCSDIVGRHVDLADRARRKEETTLETYDEAVAISLAMELAQLDLLRQFHGVEYSQSAMAYGYSLGEIGALAAGGVITLEDALRIPLAMAADCAELARDVTMGIVFSRGPALDLVRVQRMILRINAEGRGVLGISSILSPNSVLVLGQQDTVDRLERRLAEAFGKLVHLRRNPHRWPPLHTPLVWQKNITNRAGVLMHTIAGGFTAPVPKVLSLVTGWYSYTADNAREILNQWIDHPQRLWDAMCLTCASDIDVIIHVGPEPNLIPATFQRLSTNVLDQMRGHSLAHMGRRAVGFAARSWLRTLLPTEASLLRAPSIKHVILEDWLLENGADI